MAQPKPRGGKLDMGLAWTQATALIGANRDTISAIAGLFFFVPSMALTLFAPELSGPQTPPPPDADPRVAFQAMIDQMTQAYAANWPLVAATTLMQFIGSLGLLALLTDRGRPTVREALITGLASLLPYVAALLISVLCAALVVALPAALAAQFASPVAAVVVLAMMVVAVYLLVKFTLIGPAIAIDGIRNPIKALQRSWQLTKGNSLRIVAFQFLLIFTIGIIAALVTGILGLVFSALGGEVAILGNGAVGALINALITVIFLTVFAAIHRQLAGHTPEGLAATFE